MTVDRSDAVNLAGHIIGRLDTGSYDTVSGKGVKCLADAVLRMDEALKNAAPQGQTVPEVRVRERSNPGVPPAEAAPVTPFLKLAEVLDRYDLITVSLDQADYEADFVMRAVDWQVLRAAFRSLTARPPELKRDAQAPARGASPGAKGSAATEET